MQVTDKKVLRKRVNKVCRGVLFYLLIGFVVVTLDFLIRNIDLILQDINGEVTDAVFFACFDKYAEDGWSSILSVLIGILFLTVYFPHRQSFCADKNPSIAITSNHHMFRNFLLNLNTHQKRTPRAKMTLPDFVKYLCVFMSTQLIFTFVAIIVERGLNLFGYTNASDIAAATDTSMTFSMFLYASIIGPITEEIVYRGFAMKSLEQFGKEFAILFSSILFGIMHGNLCQSLFACSTGIVLGHVAMEYSIKWSILLHLINNCVFGDLLDYMLLSVPELIQDIIVYGILILFFLASTVILWKGRERIKKYHEENRADGKLYKYAFTSCWFILFTMLQVMSMFSGIQKI